MAKKPVKAKSRVVTGRAKSNKSLSLTKRSALFGLVGVLAFSVVTGFGYQKWQDHQLKAKAASLSCLLNSNRANPGVCIKACKTYIVGGYGPVWRVTWFVDRYSNPAITMSLRDTFRGSARSSYQYYYSWWANSYQQFDSYQSAITSLNDSTAVSVFKGPADTHGWGVSFFSTTGISGVGVYNPNTIANC